MYEVSTKLHDEVRPAEHEGLEVLYCLNKPMNLEYRSNLYRICPAEMIVLNGLEKHTEIHQHSNITYRSLIVDAAYVNQLLSECDIQCKDIVFNELLIRHSPVILQSIEQLFLLRATQWNVQYVIDFFISSLVTEILLIHKNSQTKKLQRYVEHAYFPDVVKKAKKYMLDHLWNGDLNLDELAKSSGMSKFHFLRIFKKTQGVTPINYFNRIRCEIILSILTGGSARITELAFQLNFNHLSSFYALFQKVMSMSPGNARKLSARLPVDIVETTYAHGLTKI